MISVVFLTKDGGPRLREAIQALNRQDLDEDVEIIAVDSGSPAHDLEYLADNGVRVVPLPFTPFRFGRARQYAFGLCSGEIIVTMSQDVVPFDNLYLQRLVNPILAGECDVVQGVTQPPADPAIFYWDAKEAFYFTRLTRNFTERCKGALSCACLAMSRESWAQTGFGDEPYCEDKGIQLRLLRKDFDIRPVQGPIAYHGHSYSLLSLVKRCHNEGVGWRSVGQKYRLAWLVRDLFCSPWRYSRVYWIGLRRGGIRDVGAAFFFQIKPLGMFIGNRLLPFYWA